MAEYFTHFSCLLDVGTPDKAARALGLFQGLREADQDADEPEIADAVMGRPPGAEADPELFPLGNSGAWLLDSGCLSLGSRGE